MDEELNRRRIQHQGWDTLASINRTALWLGSILLHDDISQGISQSMAFIGKLKRSRCVR